VESEAIAIVGNWYCPGGLYFRRRGTLPDNARGFAINLSLYTDAKKFPGFNPEGYGYTLTEKAYDPRVLARFKVWDAGNHKIVIRTSDGVWEYKPDSNTKTTRSIPPNTNRAAGEIIGLYLVNNATDIVTVLSADWSEWEEITFHYDPDRSESVVAMNGQKYQAIDRAEIEMGEYTVTVLSAGEAQRTMPISEFTATKNGNGVLLDWESRSFSGFYGYNVYQADSYDGPYKKTSATLLQKSACTISDLTAGQRVFFKVAGVHTDLGEGPASIIRSVVLA
jgi:hypothetical protein